MNIASTATGKHRKLKMTFPGACTKLDLNMSILKGLCRRQLTPCKCLAFLVDISITSIDSVDQALPLIMLCKVPVILHSMLVSFEHTCIRDLCFKWAVVSAVTSCSPLTVFLHEI